MTKNIASENNLALSDDFIGQKIMKLYKGRKVGHSAVAELPIYTENTLIDEPCL